MRAVAQPSRSKKDSQIQHELILNSGPIYRKGKAELQKAVSRIQPFRVWLILPLMLAWLGHLPLGAESAWYAIGPAGGDVRGIALNPANPSEMYAVTGAHRSKIYKSDNSGQTWELRIIVDSYLCHIAIAPSNPDIVYALGMNSVFKSADRGATWKEYQLGASSYGYEGEIAVSRTNPQRVFACGYSLYSAGGVCPAIFKSTDGGLSWSTKVLSPSSPFGGAHALALDPGNDNVIYVGGADSSGSESPARLFRSVDGGNSWTNISGSIDGYLESIAVDAKDSSRVYVGTTWGVFRSADGGQTWARNDGIVYATAVAIDPADSNTIFAGHTESCYKSTDGGINWTKNSLGLYGSCHNLLITGSALFYASTAGIYKSRDGGMAWQASYTGISSANVPALAVASSSPNVLYIAVKDDAFFKSDAFGLSWERLPDFAVCDDVRKIAVDPGDDDRLFILAGG